MNNARAECCLPEQEHEPGLGKRLRNLFPASILNYLIALAAIFSLNFILPRLMPGDPLQAIYGQEALVAMTPEMEAQLIRQFSLDKSWWDQLLAYVLGLLQGDLGFSYYYREQVFQVIMGALPWTLLLTGLALIIATAIGLILGIESGFKRGSSLDRGLVAGLMFLGGFPDFFIGILLLLIFAVSLDVFPLSGATSPYAGYDGFCLHLRYSQAPGPPPGLHGPGAVGRHLPFDQKHHGHPAGRVLHPHRPGQRLP